MKPDLAEVQAYVSDKMDNILGCFKAGCKITVLVRVPDMPTADFMMTSDEIPEVIAMLERRQKAGMDK